MTSIDLNITLAQLDANPLSHLMLGHRELFHSNLLSWFFHHLPEAADQVFLPLTRQDAAPNFIRSAFREKENIDIKFTWPNKRPLILELKIFSLPVQMQLQDYRYKNLNTDASFCLLSMVRPSWISNEETTAQGWQLLTFRDIGEAIRSALTGSKESYAQQTMLHYAKMLGDLSDLVDLTLAKSQTEIWNLPEPISRILKDSRFRPSISKLRANSIAYLIQKALFESGFDGDLVSAGMSHSQPLVEWFDEVPHTEYLRWGWQLQGGQFRLVFSHRDRENLYEEHQQKLERYMSLLDFSEIDSILGTSNLAVLPKKGINRFGAHFIYRYKMVPSDLSVSQLCQASVKLAQILKSHNGVS